MQGNKDNCYYVYQVKLDGEVVYIGKGKGDRWKHPTSGKSHVLAFNEMYFKGESDRLVVAFIHDNLSSSVAVEFENELILKHKPLYNCVGKLDKDKTLLLGKIFTKTQLATLSFEEIQTKAFIILSKELNTFRQTGVLQDGKGISTAMAGFLVEYSCFPLGMLEKHLQNNLQEERDLVEILINLGYERTRRHIGDSSKQNNMWRKSTKGSRRAKALSKKEIHDIQKYLTSVGSY